MVHIMAGSYSQIREIKKVLDLDKYFSYYIGNGERFHVFLAIAGELMII